MRVRISRDGLRRSRILATRPRAARLRARAHLDDVRLMVVGGGRDRTLSEWRSLLTRGGFELQSVHRAPPPPPGGSAACNLAVLVARTRVVG